MVICCIFGSGTYQNVYAEELNGEVSDSTDGIVLNVISYDEENNRSLAIISSTHTANAEVAGNGVRLRVSPSTSATVLELMYEGETVWIDWSKYGQGGASWYYIQRIKTGTYGWASKDYVYHWD